jgi:hypothetical protein
VRGTLSCVAKREEARALRARGLVVSDIAASLGVPPSTVYGWVRDLPVPPRSSWRRRPVGGPNRLRDARLAEVAECSAWARSVVGGLSEDAFVGAGIALYAGEGAKRDGEVALTNTDPDIVAFFCRWLRQTFDVDESRLRAHLYLHADLDLDGAVRFWSDTLAIPPAQFTKPYRAVVDPTRRTRRHEHGCITVRYACSRTHRRVMGLCRALLSSPEHDPA